MFVSLYWTFPSESLIVILFAYICQNSPKQPTLSFSEASYSILLFYWLLHMALCHITTTKSNLKCTIHIYTTLTIHAFGRCIYLNKITSDICESSRTLCCTLSTNIQHQISQALSEKFVRDLEPNNLQWLWQQNSTIWISLSIPLTLSLSKQMQIKTIVNLTKEIKDSYHIFSVSVLKNFLRHPKQVA